MNEQRQGSPRLGRWLAAARLPLASVVAVVVVALVVKGGSLTGVFSKRSADVPPHNADEHGNRRATSGAEPEDTRVVKLASPEEAQRLGIEFATVEPRSLESFLVCNGRVSFNQNRFAEIRPRVEGIVRHVGFDVGAQVQPGDILSLVDSAALGDIKASYINALTRKDFYEQQYDRLKRLTDQQALPTKTLLETEALMHEQQISAASHRQQLVNLGFTADQITALVEGKDTSTELPVLAPIEGVVVQRHAVDGELVDRSHTLFTVTNLETMWVYLSCYESDLHRIKVGQPVSFTADGMQDASFQGIIDWISPEVDAQTRTTQVRVIVENTGRALRANMYGRGKILVHSSRAGLVVPETAVQWYHDRPVVFVSRALDEFECRSIDVGIKGERYWEVTSGLTAGEKVATTGSFQLKADLEP